MLGAIRIKLYWTWVSIADFFWVVQAYVRGKVLGQKSYQPEKGVIVSEVTDFFKLPARVSVAREMMLMRWWRLRPLTYPELMTHMDPNWPLRR